MPKEGIFIEFKSKIPAAKAFYEGGIYNWLEGAGEIVKEKAKENVSPGKGPGPHPHKEYPGWPVREDTGNLEKSVTTYGPYDISKDVKAKEVGGDGSVDYGKKLECGWVDPRTGNEWRYPWLRPALDSEWGRIIRLLREIGGGSVIRTR